MPSGVRDREIDMEAESFTDVSMRLTQDVIDDADFIEDTYSFPDKATAVGAAPALARLVAEHAGDSRRSRVVIHSSDGSKYEVKLPWKASR